MTVALQSCSALSVTEEARCCCTEGNWLTVLALQNGKGKGKAKSWWTLPLPLLYPYPCLLPSPYLGPGSCHKSTDIVTHTVTDIVTTVVTEEVTSNLVLSVLCRRSNAQAPWAGIACVTVEEVWQSFRTGVQLHDHHHDECMERRTPYFHPLNTQRCCVQGSEGAAQHRWACVYERPCMRCHPRSAICSPQAVQLGCSYHRQPSCPQDQDQVQICCLLWLLQVQI